MTTTTGVAALCLVALTGCTATMSHHDAWDVVVGGILGAASLLGLAKLFVGGDSGGSRVAAGASVLFALGLIAWTVNGFVSLLAPEPMPGTGSYRCTVAADHHVTVTIQNVGQTVLMVGSLEIQPEDAQGRAEGKPVVTFLPAIMKMPKHFAVGETRTFDVGDLTTPGRQVPARCVVTGAFLKGGAGHGSLLSSW